MPRTYPPKRTHTAVRLSPEGLEAIDAIAQAEDRPRSWVIRKLLGEALQARQSVTPTRPTPRLPDPGIPAERGVKQKVKR